jgi:hypothetical protein
LSPKGKAIHDLFVANGLEAVSNANLAAGQDETLHRFAEKLGAWDGLAGFGVKGDSR